MLKLELKIWQIKVEIATEFKYWKVNKANEVENNRHITLYQFQDLQIKK